MSPTSRTPEELITEALHHLHLVEQYTTHDLSSTIVLDAVSLRLAAAIDAIGALPPPLRDEATRNDRRLLRGMGNRLVHGYLAVDETVIRKTATEDVPRLVADLERLA